MTLLEKRSNTREALAEKSYIQKVLREESENIDKAQREASAGFQPETIAGSFSVENTTLVHRHQPRQRFIDMKKRKTKAGPIKKKNYQVHNKPVYGVLNNIIRRLHFGYTEAAKQEMLKLQNQQL